MPPEGWITPNDLHAKAAQVREAVPAPDAASDAEYEKLQEDISRQRDENELENLRREHAQLREELGEPGMRRKLLGLGIACFVCAVLLTAFPFLPKAWTFWVDDATRDKFISSFGLIIPAFLAVFAWIVGHYFPRGKS